MPIFKYNFELNPNNIKKIRLKRGISQKELANKCGIHASNLSNYENCKESIPISKFNDICNYLEISFDYALGLTIENNYNNKVKVLDKKVIGTRLKKIRIDNKLYQETLAKDIGTSKSLICEYEKGVKLISLPYAYTICKKYHVSLDYLYGKQDYD